MQRIKNFLTLVFIIDFLYNLYQKYLFFFYSVKKNIYIIMIHKNRRERDYKILVYWNVEFGLKDSTMLYQDGRWYSVALVTKYKWETFFFSVTSCLLHYSRNLLTFRDVTFIDFPLFSKQTLSHCPYASAEKLIIAKEREFFSMTVVTAAIPQLRLFNLACFRSL